MRIYTENEKGDLKYVEEVDGTEDPALAVDALLDARPRLGGQEFVVLADDSLVRVEAGEEIVQPRRQIKVTGGVAPKATRRRQKAAPAEEPEEEPAPAKRTTRRSTTKKTATRKAPAKRTAAKPAARKSASTKTTAKKGGNPMKRGGGFKRNAASEGE